MASGPQQNSLNLEFVELNRSYTLSELSRAGLKPMTIDSLGSRGVYLNCSFAYVIKRIHSDVNPTNDLYVPVKKTIISEAEVLVAEVTGLNLDPWYIREKNLERLAKEKDLEQRGEKSGVVGTISQIVYYIIFLILTIFASATDKLNTFKICGIKI